ncbi:Coenzyme A transferase [Diplonema papillatum]|nr:Coenzyme A transferase [Diplonema papillatum]
MHSLVRLPSLYLRRCTQQFRLGSTRQKIVTAEDAAYLIESGSTITVGGFVGQGSPEEILYQIGQRYEKTGSPLDLTLVFGGGPGDWDSKGLNHLAKPGLIRRTIGAHYGQVPKLAQLAQDNLIEAYNLPLGAISRMIRCAAAGHPGFLTTVGMGTCVDPEQDGGRINEVTTANLVHTVEVLGKKYLFYEAVPIDVAIVRGTTSDQEGNVTMERESLYADHLIQAMSARASRGVVLVQVERQAAVGSLLARNVRIPGTLVDAVVVAAPENHRMSYATAYDPAVTGEIRAPPHLGSPKLDERKVIARRAALDLVPNQVVNLGIGMPEGIAEVASEEGILPTIELTTEPGVHGGVGLGGHDFGPAVNYDALIEMNQQFDFYNGGGLDCAFLGMAEVDVHGNVNVTRVGNKLTGPGGFIDISQCTKRVTLMGTFTAGGLKTRAKDGKLVIEREGKMKKFVKKVKEITFSGKQAVERNQVISYVTERCVFVLTRDGLALTEVAPGIDVQTQILDLMDFSPIVDLDVIREMNPKIFKEELMKVGKSSFDVSLDTRLNYDASNNTVYLDLSNMSITTPDAVQSIKEQIEAFHQRLEKKETKAHQVVNYDNFDITSELIPQWEAIAQDLSSRLCDSVRRYTGRAFRSHRLQQAIHISDDTAYDLAHVQEWAKCHGFMASENTIETLFWMLAARHGTGEKLTKDGMDELLRKLRPLPQARATALQAE